MPYFNSEIFKFQYQYSVSASNYSKKYEFYNIFCGEITVLSFSIFLSLQDTINALTNQNSILQSHMANSDNTGSNDADDNSALVASMSASVKQLEMERNQVVQRLKEEETRANDIQNKLHQLQNDLAHESK